MRGWDWGTNHLLLLNTPGEDGPSQMALEDLAMFRSVPMSTVFYPSDGVATEKAVELAANTKVSYVAVLFETSSSVERLKGGGKHRESVTGCLGRHFLTLSLVFVELKETRPGRTPLSVLHGGDGRCQHLPV